MLTKEELVRLQELKDLNADFAYFIDKYNSIYSDMISKMFHELRNPLTLVKSTIQLLERKYPETKEFRYWDQLTEDIDICVELISNFSMFGKSMKTSIKNQDLLLLLKSVIHAFQPEAEQSKKSLTLTINDDMVEYFSNYPIDKTMFRQVLINLIKNAFEATKEGDYIQVDCKLIASKLVIAVHDNGVKIPEEKLINIFDPFITYKPNGSGLGLPISRNIVNAHNGTLNAVSTKGRTSFIIELPYPTLNLEE